MISGVYKIDKKRYTMKQKNMVYFVYQWQQKKDADSVFIFVPGIALCNIYIIITFILYT